MSKRPSKPPKLCDAVIFDIDNVLVDTRKSYLDAIRLTIDIYLTDGKIPLFTRHPKQGKLTVISKENVHQFKLLGGFNDDWDCCYGLLTYLLSLPITKRNTLELKQSIDLKGFLQKVKKRPLGVNGITDLLGRHPSVKIEKIARIFQEIYLGTELFRAVEGRLPIYWKKKGLIEKERLIFKRPILEAIRALGIELGIATGRPFFEAAYALKHFEIHELFSVITHIDHVKKAEQEQKQSLRKPHPYSLLETARKMGDKRSFIYVGDLPDDILAANEAKSLISIRSVAFPTYSSEGQTALAEIQKAKPDFIIKKPRELLLLLTKK